MYWIYSTEALPSATLSGKPGYTPEYAIFHGIQVVIPQQEWLQVPDNFYTLRHKDWRDRQGERVHVATADVMKYIKAHFQERGVVVLDHEPTAAEKTVYQLQSEQANRAFRMGAVEWYEGQVREKEVTGQGRTWPTPYENECYEVLGLTKPYSVEAMRAQRHPGEAVGEQIVNALERLDARRAAAAAKPPQSANLTE